MRIKTTRLEMIPYGRTLLHLAMIDPAGAAEQIGAVYGTVSVEETIAQRDRYAMKCRIIDQHPDAWLFATAWQIVSLESRLILGEIGFKGIHPNGEIEIGYHTRSEHRCRGIMTEAVQALCLFAFRQTDFPISVISACTKEGNIASEKVLLHNGFQRKGTRFGFNYWVKKP